MCFEVASSTSMPAASISSSSRPASIGSAVRSRVSGPAPIASSRLSLAASLRPSRSGGKGLSALPVGILGTFVGAKLTRIMPDKLFFGLVQAALFIVSLKLVWDALYPSA